MFEADKTTPSLLEIVQAGRVDFKTRSLLVKKNPETPGPVAGDPISLKQMSLRASPPENSLLRSMSAAKY